MKSNRKITVQVDPYTRCCLTALVVLLAVLIVGVWADGPAWVGAARAADGNRVDGTFGDTGPRVAALLDGVKETNAKLDALLKVMTSGQVKVQVVNADRKGDGEDNAGKK